MDSSILSSEELKCASLLFELEKALLVPEEGIVDYSAVMQKMVN